MMDWIAGGRKAAEELLHAAELPGGMADRLRAAAEAEAAAEPFITGAPERLEQLRGRIEGLLAGTAGDLAQLLGDRESEASREATNLYRIALKFARSPAAKQVVVDLSANKAYRSIEANHPELASDLVAHLQEYGWVRTVSTGLEVASPKEVMQRIQVALLRWDAGTLAGVAEPPEVVGPETAGGLGALVEDYRTISGDPAFSPALPVRAKWVARLFYGEVASTLGSPLHRVLNTPARALLNAVESGAALPDLPSRPVLAGAAVSLGRATGRVKVILDADQGDRIRVGDIIVTNLSTPTYEGEPSIFPYRGIASVPIEKAAAIVTDEGGLLSHAAIVCRENSVPSLLGAEGASETLGDGMIVEVDATRANGTVTILQP